MSLTLLFTTLIYQPFFNVLVFFYWGLNILTQGHGDMGMAVILLTVLIRLLLLPISLMEEQSEEDRRGIARRVAELNEELSHDPILLRKEISKLFKSKPSVVAGEIFSLFIQVGISLMLWRIFSRGLEGEDLHLLYPFMPDVAFPYNLTFWGRFDLAHPDLVLNLTQSLCIFLLETISIYTSPYPPARGEVVRLQLVLPVVSFLVFMMLPAGKKLFVITTLIFSIILTILKAIKRKFDSYREEKEAEEALAIVQPPDEKIVVQVK